MTAGMEEWPGVQLVAAVGWSLLRWSAPCLASMAALLLVFMVYFYAPYWKVRKVPGPPPSPLVGHLPLLAKYGPDAFRLLAKEYGPIYRFHMGRQPLVIVADPELCREVGIKKFKDMKNRTSPSPTSGSPLHEKGLFLTRDARWSSMRNAIIPYYQPSHLSRLVPTMQSFIETATQDLSINGGDEIINFSHVSLKLAIDVIGNCAFGFDFGLSRPPPAAAVGSSDYSGEASGFLKQHIYSTESLKMDLTGSISIILGLVAPVLQPLFRWLLGRIPGTTDHRMRRTSESVRRVLDEVVRRRSTEVVGAGAADFLSAILLAARESPAARGLFTGDYVSALAFEHLLAGSATTAFTVSAVVYLVSKHPEVEKKLLEEIDTFGPPDRTPTADDLHRHFPYLDQVVKEAMRFYTVSPLVARQTSRQVEIGGYTLPKGTWVWMALGVLAKDAKNFPRPEQFRPERFDPAGAEEKLRHPYAHIPFGLGPRMCIGHKFALQEIKLTLVHLYRSYVFELPPEMDDPPELEYGLVLNFKHGIKVRAVRRTGSV